MDSGRYSNCRTGSEGGGWTIARPRYRQLARWGTALFPLDAVVKLLVGPPAIEPFPSAKGTQANGSSTVGV